VYTLYVQARELVSEDRRVARTRASVLLSARALLMADGADAVTFSALASQTGLSRQTIYNHWPTRERLLGALLVEGAGGTYPQATTDLRRTTARWLAALRDSLLAPSAVADAMATVMLDARRDDGSRHAIELVIENHRVRFNQHIAGMRKGLSRDEWSRLVGPVFFRLFVSFEPVTNRFLSGLAADLVSQ
jgi:AcrR family transcriptional regulator